MYLKTTCISNITPSIVSGWQEIERAPVICNYIGSASALIGFGVTPEPAMLRTISEVLRLQTSKAGRFRRGGESFLKPLAVSVCAFNPRVHPREMLHAHFKKKKNCQCGGITDSAFALRNKHTMAVSQYVDLSGTGSESQRSCLGR